MTARRVFRNGAWQPAPTSKAACGCTVLTVNGELSVNPNCLYHAPQQPAEPKPTFTSIAEQYAHLLDAISERLARAPHSCAAFYDLEYVTDLPCLRCDLERLLESEPK